MHYVSSNRIIWERIKGDALAKRLNILIEMAKRTLKAITQHAVRTTDDPALTRKHRTNDRILNMQKQHVILLWLHS